jgi:Ca2+-binding RTX toxin-like protein
MPYPTSTILVPFLHGRGSANESTITTTLVIFDSQVIDLPLLHTALLPGSISHTIQPHQDPIDTITHLLTQTGASKLAIVAHGQPGAIQIGNGVIDRAMLEARSGLLQEWGVDSIALYSCEVGTDAEFIQRFSELTGAQIAASTSKIGAGNWELDSGLELLSIGQLADYSATLIVTFTGTGGNDTADSIGFGTLIPPYLTGFTGGTVDDLIDGTGDVFDGYDGNDIIYAGNGDDRINANYAKGTNNGGGGNDFLYINTAVNGVDYKVVFTAPNAGLLYINDVQTGTFTSIEQLYFLGYGGDDTVDASLANLSITTPGASYYTALNINGQFGNDTLIGSAGNDTIVGGSGNDTITGNAGSNILDGGAGNDRINAGYMRDTIDGGSDSDFLYIRTQTPTDAYTVKFTSANTGELKVNGVQTGTFTNIEQLYFKGYDGNDVINASLANLTGTAQGVAQGYSYGLNILGEAGSDTVLGSAYSDQIYGGNDNDFLYGQGGNDLIDGDAGYDIIFGQAGVDTLNGGDLNDTIFGGTGYDTINGNDGEDYLYGEEDNDRIYGGYGFDVIYGQAGNDTIYGEGVTFDVSGYSETTALLSGIGINDTIFGGIGNDFIYGGIGNDLLLGEEGADQMNGGDGNDFIYGGIGDDLFNGDAGNDYLVGQDGNDYIYGEAGTDYIEGGAGNDIIVGDVGDITVGNGNNPDYLYGNAGDDLLNGNAGDDFLDGGDGIDILRGDDGTDTLFGVEGDDFLYGGNGVDYLYAGNGNDTLRGDAGNDFLIGGAGSDTFAYAAMTDAGDTITDFSLAEIDKLNFTALFSGLGVASGVVDTNYLKFASFGTNIFCLVDQDGSGGTANFVTMATIANTAGLLTPGSFVIGINVLV